MLPFFFAVIGLAAASEAHPSARRVAALYVRRTGIYPTLDGVDAWDVDADARRYAGPWPIVAHPPCGPWGRFAYRTKQDKTLGPLAVDQVRTWGGVLEHPVDSRLWAAKGLPKPGEPPDAWGGWTLLVTQASWGHRAPKWTWLYIVGVKPEELPPRPPDVPDPGGRVEFMCEAERERTPPAFAEWLLEVARRSSVR